MKKPIVAKAPVSRKVSRGGLTIRIPIETRSGVTSKIKIERGGWGEVHPGGWMQLGDTEQKQTGPVGQWTVRPIERAVKRVLAKLKQRINAGK
jgi:hypothetical protein